MVPPAISNKTNHLQKIQKSKKSEKNLPFRKTPLVFLNNSKGCGPRISMNPNIKIDKTHPI